MHWQKKEKEGRTPKDSKEITFFELVSGPIRNSPQNNRLTMSGGGGVWEMRIEITGTGSGQPNKCGQRIKLRERQAIN